MFLFLIFLSLAILIMMHEELVIGLACQSEAVCFK